VQKSLLKDYHVRPFSTTLSLLPLTFPHLLNLDGPRLAPSPDRQPRRHAQDLLEPLSDLPYPTARLRLVFYPPSFPLRPCPCKKPPTLARLSSPPSRSASNFTSREHRQTRTPTGLSSSSFSTFPPFPHMNETKPSSSAGPRSSSSATTTPKPVRRASTLERKNSIRWRSRSRA
jgi:hypothetical protein